ncbi:MAG TPA: DNA methyltransferase [Elusimicrobia bacterium]|nr:DNA methyltransferase [Elusimicrobiota bacterium]
METEGIKYTGSKRLIIPYILELIKTLNVKTVLDGFSGTTRVSQALKKSGYTVFSNDTSVWSKVFAECYLMNRKPPDYYLPIISHLNKLKGRHGWFSENYGGKPNGGSSVQGDGKKRIWQVHNTMKLDAIREEIDNIAKNEIEKSVLLTSLILAMDKIDSTLGHQVSYLREWAPRSYSTMKMEVPKLIIDDKDHKVFQKDIFELIKNIKVDLAYFDPPYGSSNEKMPPSRVRYASYYHIWKTICLNDKPNLVGASNRREDASDTISSSVFEDFRKTENGKYIVSEAIKKLIVNTSARYVILSYSNEGRSTYNEIIEMFDDLKLKYDVLEIDYKKNVMAGMVWTKEWLNGTAENNQRNIEYLFFISRDKAKKFIPIESIKKQKEFDFRAYVPA